MCGIVGYIGSGDALAVILGGLEKLEYRGYDSAGVALVEAGELNVTRALGKLSELKKTLTSKRGSLSSRAQLGIGHTRWATHGKPSENNAHPHTAGPISLVHNGIIENYLELRAELEAEGRSFQSETDTEIAAHLLDHYVQENHSPIEALEKCCDRIRGSYSFVAINAENPSRLFVAKSATPMVIGVGNDEVIVASDIPAVLEHTRNIIILEDGDIAELAPGSIAIRNGGKAVQRAPETVTWDPIAAQKGGYKHYMLKEIHEQVQALADSFRGRISLESSEVLLPELQLSAEKLRSLRRIVFVACGTTWHACLVAKYWIERHTGIACEVDYASEFRYRSPVLDADTLVIGVSQSGETADTLAAVDHAQKTSETLAVCNVLGSSLSRRAKHVMYTQAGPEISVAATKSFTTQLTCLYVLSIYFGARRGTLSAEAVAALLDDLSQIPHAVSEALKCDEQVEQIAREICKARDFLYVGRGICYPIALEGALKMKEISYIHAEGYPAGEMKHGPIALIDEQMPIVAIVQNSPVLTEKMISNLKEAEARGGTIILISDLPSDSELVRLGVHRVLVPHISEALAPILLTVPIQLLAYHVAVLNGTDVDLPRNLAKSVTVE